MKNNKIIVSIITPFYNCKKLLVNHINQAKKFALDLSVEFIYIDDGSNDHGYESIRKNIEKCRKM